ncbi:MAG: hypothetical protein J6A15_08165 [Clostridia bacterium]|nr:hypothetical protein [Clostridia bacterium]
MKRWAIVLMSITLCMVLGNNVFATDDVEIYQEPQIQNKGRIVMNFYSTDSKEQITNSSPIENVQVELYYRYKKVMYNVKELDIFKYTNLKLTSDENGKIVLTNLPYGLYQYKIVSAPSGFEYDSEIKKIDLNLMNETINEDLYLVKEIIMAEGTTEEEIKEEVKEEIKEEIVEEEKVVNSQIIPSIKEEDNKIQQIIIVGKKDEEAINKTVNVMATNLYTSNESTSIVQNTETTVEKEIMQKVSEVLTRRAKKKKVDTISQMRTIRITEKIKVAVLSREDTMYYLKGLENNKSKDPERIKDTKRKILDKLNDKKYKNLGTNMAAKININVNAKG